MGLVSDVIHGLKCTYQVTLPISWFSRSHLGSRKVPTNQLACILSTDNTSVFYTYAKPNTLINPIPGGVWNLRYQAGGVNLTQVF